MQPTYFPWIGYFDLIDRVDKFVFLDNVKLEKSDWHVRNRIKTANDVIFLTIPLSLKDGRMKTKINTATVKKHVPWQKKHLRGMQYAYRKAEHYDAVYPFLEELLSGQFELLSEWTIHIIRSISNRIGIDTEFLEASRLGEIPGIKDGRLVNICRKIECEKYLSPQGSADYLERNNPGGELLRNNIALYYQNFIHPQYCQLYGDFISHLSIIDLLFNCGFEKALPIIRSGRGEAIDCVSFRKEFLNYV